MRIIDCEEKTAIEALNKIKKDNMKLNHIVTFIEPIKKGKGKLNNVPIVLKDNVYTKDILTTASCKLLNNFYPKENAHIVDLLEKEGAVIIGKSSMDELAMGGTNLSAATGACLNPYDLNRISGGSSGGSAVVVATGGVPVAIGTDTGDSIRKPASYNGVVGVKPSYGRISRYGVIPFASSLDHVGYFTTNIEDAALMLEVIAGRDDKDETSSYEKVEEYSKNLTDNIKGKKILIFNNVIDEIKDEEIINAFNLVITNLKEKGAIVEEVSYNEKLMKAIFPTYYIIANSEAVVNHRKLPNTDEKEEILKEKRTNCFSYQVKKRFVVGSYASEDNNQERMLKKAKKLRRLIVDEVMSKLKDADCLIAPAASSIAPKVNEAKIDVLSDKYSIADNHMVIGNFAGLPSLTIPMGYSKGMPVGVNITCNRFKEQDMFNIGLAIENSTGLKGYTKKDF